MDSVLARYGTTTKILMVLMCNLAAVVMALARNGLRRPCNCWRTSRASVCSNTSQSERTKLWARTKPLSTCKSCTPKRTSLTALKVCLCIAIRHFARFRQSSGHMSG